VTSKSGNAIFGGDRDETVLNSGLVAGNVDLGLGHNSFSNFESASFYTGSIVNLNGGVLLNEGLLSPGGPGVIQTTSLNGSLIETGSAKYAVDISIGDATSDRINATGSATVDGKVLPDIIANPQSGKHQVTILSANGGVTNGGLSLADSADTAAV